MSLLASCDSKNSTQNRKIRLRVLRNNSARAIFSTTVLWICLCCCALLVAAQEKAQTQNKERDTCTNYLGREGPKYRIARKFHTETNYGSALHIYLSINEKDVTRDNLLTLGCKLGIAYANEGSLFVRILDTRRAAKRFVPLGDPGNDRQTNMSYRGFYAFWRGKDGSGQSLDWKPNRDDPNQWVDIDLGLPPQRHTSSADNR
jgi:hypothetical protein